VVFGCGYMHALVLHVGRREVGCIYITGGSQVESQKGRLGKWGRGLPACCRGVYGEDGEETRGLFGEQCYCIGLDAI
jgi:hypothetical protein